MSEGAGSIVAKGVLGIVLGKGGEALIGEFKAARAAMGAGPQEAAVRDWKSAMDAILGLDLPDEGKAHLEKVKLGTEVLQDMLDREVEKAERQREIVTLAAESLPPNTDVHELNEEWKEWFSNHARSANSTEMRAMWAHILATEATSPGSVSKRAMDDLAKFDLHDVDTLAEIASRTVITDHPFLLFDERDSRQWGTPDFIQHGLDIGLIAATTVHVDPLFDPKQSISLGSKETIVLRLSDGKLIRITNSLGHGRGFRTPSLQLTKLGSQLVSLPTVPPHESVHAWLKWVMSHNLDFEGYP